MNRFTGSSDEDVKPAAPRCFIERPKISSESSISIQAKGGADDEVVPLVSLDIFKILDEQSLE